MNQQHQVVFMSPMQKLIKANGLVIVILAIVGIFFLGRHLYLRPDVKKDQMAPGFTATLPDGSAFDLESLRGQYVLLNFWGSWCGPCRKEFPELKSLYHSYHPKLDSGNAGLQIVSVGIESQRSRWEGTIRSQGLNWPYHTSDFQMFDSPLANLYGIREIPAKIFIDTDGRILEVNPSFERIRNILDREILNKG